ncbi:MAG: hydrolase [Gammaproteobacteria bacterium RIFCSPHIGHO2_12_FULL_35_23]|nr:MAG: hydrolase [Gammaproteobacteria bacterium RIFCSPHIGHO2_12_FULL_35_23]
MKQQHEIKISYLDLCLLGNLAIPSNAQGLVIFVHGSGSSRFSPRNQYVAKALNHHKFSTLLFDLLTKEEEAIDQVTAELRFNIPLLAARLIVATNWILEQDLQLPIGYFGASTGAAAALIAATRMASIIQAVVSRGGRPDLAKEALKSVKAPTLLIVGELDSQVIKLNEQAQKEIGNQSKLVLVPGATHLFEEPGTLDTVNQLAVGWFSKYLPITEFS